MEGKILVIGTLFPKDNDIKIYHHGCPVKVGWPQFNMLILGNK
jgi:hypothetical protein